MQWEHNVDRKWLKARRNYITASDIVSLLPKYKKLDKILTNKEVSLAELPIKEQATLLKDFIKAYLVKSSNESIITKSPSNDAARGHILEPYAVEEYNEAYAKKKPTLYNVMRHWDDALIHRVDVGYLYSLAYSPDAMDVKQPTDDVKYEYTKDGMIADDTKSSSWDSPTQILEIKSYGKEKHATKILQKKTSLEERYQIATAMCVCGTIKVGHLCLYNPNSVSPVEVRSWTVEELANEMATVETILAYFNQAAEVYHELKPVTKSKYSEREIHAAYMKEHVKQGRLLRGE